MVSYNLSKWSFRENELEDFHIQEKSQYVMFLKNHCNICLVYRACAFQRKTED